MTVLGPVKLLDVQSAIRETGPVQVQGILTSSRTYQSKTGEMLLFTLDDRLSGVMFASDWSGASQQDIQRAGQEHSIVTVEGDMTTYRGKPSLQAHLIRVGE